MTPDNPKFPEEAHSTRRLKVAIDSAFSKKDYGHLKDLMDQIPLQKGARWARLIDSFQNYPALLAAVVEIMTPEDTRDYVEHITSSPDTTNKG